MVSPGGPTPATAYKAAAVVSKPVSSGLKNKIGKNRLCPIIVPVDPTLWHRSVEVTLAARLGHAKT